jgi:hypothetical protein
MVNVTHNCWILEAFPSSEMLHCVYWQLVTDVSGKHIDPVFNVQAAEEEMRVGSDGLHRNVGNYIQMLRDIPKERRPYLRCGETVKPGISQRYKKANWLLLFGYGEEWRVGYTRYGTNLAANLHECKLPILML